MTFLKLSSCLKYNYMLGYVFQSQCLTQDHYDHMEWQSKVLAPAKTLTYTLDDDGPWTVLKLLKKSCWHREVPSDYELSFQRVSWWWIRSLFFMCCDQEHKKNKNRLIGKYCQPKSLYARCLSAALNITKEGKCCCPLLPDKKTGEFCHRIVRKQGKTCISFTFLYKRQSPCTPLSYVPYSLFTAVNHGSHYNFLFLLRNCLIGKLHSNTSRRVKPLSSSSVLGIHQSLSSLSGVVYAHRSNYATVKWNSKESSSRMFRN